MSMINRLSTAALLVCCIVCFMSCNTNKVNTESVYTISAIISNYDASTDADKVSSIIHKAQNDTSYNPVINLVYENADTLLEIIYADSISIKYTNKGTKEIQTLVKEKYNQNFHNIKQLIGCINPLSCPYYYGNNIVDDGAFLIKIDGTIIVVDMDASRSVIPYDLLQIYQLICLDVLSEVYIPWCSLQ